MFRSFGNHNFLAVFLDKELQNCRSIRNPIANRETPYFVNLFKRILLVYAKRFDGEYEIVIVLIGEPPNIRETSGCERSLARAGERGSNCVGSGKDSI